MEQGEMEQAEVVTAAEISTLDRYSNWSLGDILEYSDELVSGQVNVFTPDKRVEDGEMVVNLGQDTNSLTFKTTSDSLIDLRTARENRFSYSEVETDEGTTQIYEDKGMRIVIRPQLEEKRGVEVTFNNRTFAYFDLRVLGWGDILKDNDFPSSTTPEYASRLLKEGKLVAGRHQIPVIEAGNTRIRDSIKEPEEGKVQVFHGTSLKDALLIAEIGLFAEGGSVRYRPILSGRPDGMTEQLAKDEWETYTRTDPSEFGAIIVFEVDPGEIETSSDVGGEKLFHPTHKPDRREVERLQLGKGKSLPNNNPRYLPGDRIAQIILVKQTPRQN